MELRQFDISFIKEEEDFDKDLFDQMKLFHRAVSNGEGLTKIGQGMKDLGKMISFLNHIVYTSRLIESQQEKCN